MEDSLADGSTEADMLLVDVAEELVLAVADKLEVGVDDADRLDVEVGVLVSEADALNEPLAVAE